MQAYGQGGKTSLIRKQHACSLAMDDAVSLERLYCSG